MSKPGLAARQAAAALLTGVLVDHEMLSEQIDDPGGKVAALEPSERARAGSIALGVLRNLEALDRALQRHIKKPPPLKVTQVLRIAAWEMLMDGVPAHAAVDAAVSAVKSARKVAHLSGLTNAVSRKLSKDAEGFAPKAGRLPKELRGDLVGDWGAEAVGAIEAVHHGEPPLDLTLRSQDHAARMAEALGAEVLPTGSLRTAKRGQVSALPGFEDGAFWVQDAAAAIPVKLLGDVAGLRVLDLCAAPGGKTMQLAALGAKVTALDSSDKRMKRLAENLKRTKLSAELVTANVLKWKAEAPYDVIVLDAPCSATGTIRRHPDLPYIRKKADIAPLITLQARMLARAFGWLKPEGRLLYCTCSLLKAEGEAHISKLMSKGFEGAAQMPDGMDPAWMSEDGLLRLRPDYWAERGGMDGFFAAVLKKPKAV